MKSANAFKISNKILIQASSQTDVGVWISDGEVYISNVDNISELANNLKSALQNSKCNIPHPAQSQWKSIQMPLLNAAGVRTWNNFAKKVSCVGVECDNSIVTFKPSTNYFDKGGTELIEKKLTCDVNDKVFDLVFVKALDSAT